MSSVKVATLVALPIAAFVCVFVAMYWCLFVNKSLEQDSNKEPAGSFDGGAEIAKTLSKEESDGPLPSFNFEDPSVLTEDPAWKKNVKVAKSILKAPKYSFRNLVSQRLVASDEEQRVDAGQEQDPSEEQFDGSRSIDNEELTLDNDVPIIASRSPARVFQKFLPTLSAKTFQKRDPDVAEKLEEGDEDGALSVDNEELTLDIDGPAINPRSPTNVFHKFMPALTSKSPQKQKKEVPTEIFHAQFDMTDFPDDETAGGRGAAGNIDDQDRTLGSQDVYTLAGAGTTRDI